MNLVMVNLVGKTEWVVEVVMYGGGQEMAKGRRKGAKQNICFFTNVA